MLAMRRRWPVLTAVAAALFYGINNYNLTGLDHLKLSAKSETPGQGMASAIEPASGDNWLGVDWTQLGINRSSVGNPLTSNPSTAVGGTSAAWGERLSAGERIAIWQDNLRSSSTRDRPDPTRLLSTSAPIPVPQGMTSAWLPATAARSVALPSTVLPPVATAAGLPPVKLKNRPPLEAIPSGSSTLALNSSFRLASFRVPTLGAALFAKPQVMQTVVAILRQYDLVALQGIQSDRDDILPMLIDKLNQSGRNYDYLIGPRVGRAAPHHQFAFLFDLERLETDRFQLYTVDDPEDLITYEPLVAWFRCKGIPPEAAFTFSIVNVSIDANFADRERSVLPNLIEAIERDGRNEDDWILAGDFAGGNVELSFLEQRGARFALRDVPTDLAGTGMFDSIVFPARATSEFTGRAGAFDFLRKYNLSLEQAQEISSHMPVWAEFHCHEGAEPGRVAPQSVY